MVHKRLLRPERRRRIPTQFSWVDHRLVGERHIERCDPDACALYLFLLTVADAQGLSYYADGSIARRLSLDESRLRAARARLVHADLVAYEHPLYQVLDLAPVPTPQPPRTATSAPRSLSDVLRAMGQRP
jgi:hypothetical protein